MVSAAVLAAVRSGVGDGLERLAVPVVAPQPTKATTAAAENRIWRTFVVPPSCAVARPVGRERMRFILVKRGRGLLVTSGVVTRARFELAVSWSQTAAIGLPLFGSISARFDQSAASLVTRRRRYFGNR